MLQRWREVYRCTRSTSVTSYLLEMFDALSLRHILRKPVYT